MVAVCSDRDLYGSCTTLTKFCIVLSLVPGSGGLSIVGNPLHRENQSKFRPQMPPYALLRRRALECAFSEATKRSPSTDQ